MREGYKKTEIGVIPVEWEIKTLSMIGSFSKGKGISKNEIIEDGIPCMRYAEIYTEYDTVLKNIKSFINEKSARNSKKIIKGDILFAGSGETLDDIGKSVAFIDDFEAYVGGDTVILSPTMDYNSLFMSFQLNSTFVRTQLRKLGQGSSVVHIYSSGLEKIKILFPPLKEQQKIANILSTTDKKIEAIDLQIQKAETLKKGLLQKLLSEGIGHSEFKDSKFGMIPVGWDLLELGNVSDILDPHPSHRAPKEEVDGYPFVGIGDISENGTINLASARKVSLADVIKQNKSIQINENDIGFGRVASVGKIIKFNKYDFPFALSPTMAVVKAKQINNSFLYQFLTSDLTKKQFKSLTSGSTRIALGIQNLRKLLIFIPPLKEQKQIAQILSISDKKLEVLRAKKEKYETLKKGLLQKLLSGEVRV